MLNYAQKLRSPLWQKKRTEIIERDNHECQHCGAKNRLHVHHKTYTYGCEPWEYPDKNLITLCFKCHLEEGYAMQEFSNITHDLLSEGFTYVELNCLLAKFIHPLGSITNHERVKATAVCSQNEVLLLGVLFTLKSVEK